MGAFNLNSLIAEKNCLKCGIYTPKCGFEKTSYKDRYKNICIDCVKENSKKWREKNKDAILERVNKWAINNPDKIKKSRKKHYELNKCSLIKSQLKYRKENPKKYLYNLAKRRAKERNVEFEICLQDLPNIPKYCPLLGIKIDSWSEKQSHLPSLDRIDSNKGYTKDNIWFISHRANMLKNNATADELLCIAINLFKVLEEK